MSYYTDMTGRVDISPPLTWAEIKNSKHYPGSREFGSTDLAFELCERDLDMVDGTLHVVTAVAIVPIDGETNGRTAEAELRELVEVFGHAHAFSGRIDGEGEDNVDMWRLKVADNAVTKYKAIITWPKESE